MAKIAQLIEGNYNILDNIPVINQDLTVSGFTPVANTYYRHTGATTASFTQGVIYLYDTAYHKLGESGGGTTLNEYAATITLTSSTANLLYRIFTEAKGRVLSVWQISAKRDSYVMLTYSGTSNVGFFNTTFQLNENGAANGYAYEYRTDTNKGSVTQYNPINNKFKIVYYNDTEIT